MRRPPRPRQIELVERDPEYMCEKRTRTETIGPNKVYRLSNADGKYLGYYLSDDMCHLQYIKGGRMVALEMIT